MRVRALGSALVVSIAVVLGLLISPLLRTEPAVDNPSFRAQSAADLAFRQASTPLAQGVATPAGLDVSRAPSPGAKPAQLRIPSIGVDAPIAVGGFDERGVMEVPADPHTVLWYQFSSLPGSRGNAVLSGHLDYAGYGPAVFWRLGKLKYGERVEIVLSDGSMYRYEVTSTQTYTAASAPVYDIIGPTTYDAVTLITCAGRFQPATRQYEERLIVRARRVSS